MVVGALNAVNAGVGDEIFQEIREAILHNFSHLLPFFRNSTCALKCFNLKALSHQQIDSLSIISRKYRPCFFEALDHFSRVLIGVWRIQGRFLGEKYLNFAQSFDQLQPPIQKVDLDFKFLEFILPPRNYHGAEDGGKSRKQDCASLAVAAPVGWAGAGGGWQAHSAAATSRAAASASSSAALASTRETMWSSMAGLSIWWLVTPER